MCDASPRRFILGDSRNTTNELEENVYTSLVAVTTPLSKCVNQKVDPMEKKSVFP